MGDGFCPGGYGAIVAIRRAIACSWRAWHEVPGNSTTLFRKGQYGAHLTTRNTSGIATPDHTVPYGTVLSLDAFPGTSCQARREQAIARRMATIMLSLRDEIHSTRRGFDSIGARLSFCNLRPIIG
jgi:hypothetical protein